MQKCLYVYTVYLIVLVFHNEDIQALTVMNLEIFDDDKFKEIFDDMTNSIRDQLHVPVDEKLFIHLYDVIKDGFHCLQTCDE